jgi:hypothetical protein
LLQTGFFYHFPEMKDTDIIIHNLGLHDIIMRVFNFFSDGEYADFFLIGIRLSPARGIGNATILCKQLN